MMEDNKLVDLSFAFAKMIVGLVDSIGEDAYKNAEKICGNIRRLLIASCNTAKKNRKQ